MERILTSHKDSGWGVLLESVIGGQNRTDKGILIRFVLRVLEIGLKTNLEEGVREDHIVEGSQQAGSEVEVVEVESWVDHDYAVWLSNVPGNK